MCRACGKKETLRADLMILLLLVGGGGCKVMRVAQAPGVVGRVVDEKSGEPVSGARVIRSPRKRSTITNSTGDFPNPDGDGVSLFSADSSCVLGRAHIPGTLQIDSPNHERRTLAISCWFSKIEELDIGTGAAHFR